MLVSVNPLCGEPPTGEPYAGEPHVRLCVQRMLACSVGDSPTGVRARSPVAWMAGRRETDDLKPIDKAIFRMVVSHQAVTKVNAEVAPKVRSPGGRVGNRTAKATRPVAYWL